MPRRRGRGDDWTVDKLRAHARESIEASGATVDEKTFARFAARLNSVSGDCRRPRYLELLAEAVGGAMEPVFTSGPARALHDGRQRDRPSHDHRERTVVVEKPIGHDLILESALAAELHRYVEEPRLYRIDHFLGKMGLHEFLDLRFANKTLASSWNREHVRR